jgi:hypothetical protein
VTRVVTNVTFNHRLPLRPRLTNPQPTLAENRILKETEILRIKFPPSYPGEPVQR